jgi:hypothetical protein
VIFSYRRWDGTPTFHITTGTACAFLFAIHFCLNRKTFAAFSKSIKKLNLSTKLKYIVDALLITVWGIAIISGFLALGSYVEIIDTTVNIGRIHGVFARVGGGLIGIHIIQHSKQIVSYIKRDYKAKR